MPWHGLIVTNGTVPFVNWPIPLRWNCLGGNPSNEYQKRTQVSRARSNRLPYSRIARKP